MVVGTCYLQGMQPLTMGKVPCEFWADHPGCSFSGEELRQGSFQPCPAQDSASSMAGGSWHDLVHLLTPVLLFEGWWQGLSIFRGGSTYHGAGPLWVSSRLVKPSFFSWQLLTWFGTFTLGTCAAHQGSFRYGPAHLQGMLPSMMGQVPCEFWVDRPNFIFQPVAPDVIWHIYSHLYCSLRDGGKGLAIFMGCCPLWWGRYPVSFEQIG